MKRLYLYQMNKICLICGHKACPICEDFCDELVKQEE